jgi:outer membrane biosynthesis protein TonB
MPNKDQSVEESLRIPASRSHARLTVQSITYIEVCDKVGGLLLNISEGGIAVQMAEQLAAKEFARMRFQLRKSGEWIEVCGKLAWENRFTKEAGIRFVEISESARSHIKKWIFAEASGQQLPKLTGRFGVIRESTEPKSEPARADRKPQAAPPAAADSAKSEGLPVAPSPKSPGPHPPAKETKLDSDEALKVARLRAAMSSGLPPSQSSPTGAHAVQKPKIQGARRSAITTPLVGLAAGLVLVALVIFGTGYLKTDHAGVSARAAAEIENSQPEAPPEPAINNATNTRSPKEPETSASEVRKSEESSTKEKAAPSASAPPSESIDRPEQPPEFVPARERESHLRPSPNPRRQTSFRPSSSSKIEPPLASRAGGTASASIAANSVEASSRFHSLRVPDGPSPQALQENENLQLGQLVSSHVPLYPADAARGRVQGVVRLRVVVDLSGAVETVGVISGPPALIQPSIEAARQWRFGQTLFRGKPIETEDDISFVFTLPDEGANLR